MLQEKCTTFKYILIEIYYKILLNKQLLIKLKAIIANKYLYGRLTVYISLRN